MRDKQLQKAHDNSLQMQAQTVYVSNGISEERVREICSEVAVKAIADNTIEAGDVAMERIERFVDLLLPRIQRIEKDFESFSDPVFQILLRKAQLSAACTEKECDYNILSELLAHRINHKDDIKKKASIIKAVEIIDQIDNDSLCALTMYHAICTFVPTSGNIVEGIKKLSELYEKINPNLLPKDNMWMDNLSILGAINIFPFSNVQKYEEAITKNLDGYVCAGIKKDSEEYLKSIELLNMYNMDTAILVENTLLEGYMRLALYQKSAIEDLVFERSKIVNDQSQMVDQPLSREQKKCLYDIFDLYSKDEQLKAAVNKNFSTLLNSFEPLATTIRWWNSLSSNFRITSIGRVIAHANAKRIDDSLPNLD